MSALSTRSLHAVALVAALAAVGCSKPATEMILVITTEGVRIPDDVHKLHLTVQDRTVSADDTVYEQDVELCHDGITTGCYDLPVSAALFPGKSRSTDSVRVQVDAIGVNDQVLIADAALFTFASEQSLRLDFVLYGNCLGNVACADRDQACGPLDTCINLGPVHVHGGVDLSHPVAEDMATPVDLAGAPPPDLVSTTDLAGCGQISCGPGTTCVAGTCQPCGTAGALCCSGGGPGACNGTTNLECNGTTCQNCGGNGQLCCTSRTPSCFSGICAGNLCQAPPLDFSMPGILDMSMPGGGADMDMAKPVDMSTGSASLDLG